MSAFTASIEDTAVPLSLTITSPLGGIVGLAPTAAVRLATTPTFYLDFDDLVFKSSGWGTRDKLLTEIRRGHYQELISIPALIAAGLDPASHLLVEYHLDEPGTKGEDQDVVLLSRDAPLTASHHPVVSAC